MSTFKVVFNRKKEQKEKEKLNAISNKREMNWNDQFYKGKMEDYTKEQNKKAHIVIEPLKPTTKPQTEKKYILQKNKPKVNIDKDLLKIWEVLQVKKEYTLKFQYKLQVFAFSDNLVQNIIETEKQNLSQIYELQIKIDNLITKKNNIMESLKNMDLFFSKTNKNSMDSKVFADIREKLENLRSIYIQLINMVSFFMEKFYNEEKFNYIKKEIKFIEPNFISNSLYELNALKDSNIGSIFKIKSPYDLFLVDFKSIKMPFDAPQTRKKFFIQKENSYVNLNKETSNLFYIILNDLIRGSNYYKLQDINLNSILKHRESSVNRERKKSQNYIDEQPLSANKYKIRKNDTEKDAIICQDKSREEEKNPDKSYHANLESNIVGQQLDFSKKDSKESFIEGVEVFSGSLNELENIYSNYYSKLSDAEKNSLNIQKSCKDLLTGINPKIIVEYTSSKKENINSLCVISTTEADNSSLDLFNISDLSSNSENLGDTLDKYMDYINANFNYKTLFVNIFYEKIENKLKVNKEINSIFTQRKFRWIKLENLDSGICFQRMGFNNDAFSEEKFKENNKSPFKIESELVILCSDSEKKVSNSDSNFNSFLKEIAEKANENNLKDLKKIKENCPELKFFASEDSNLDSLNLNIDSLKDLKLIKSYYNHFEYMPILNNSMFTSINGKNYLRIYKGFDILYDKNLDQKFYIIISNDPNYALIFCEMNQKFKDKISKEKNIYNAFNEIYPNLNACDDKINSLYIPEMNIENKNIGDIGNTQIQQFNCAVWHNTVNCQFEGEISLRPEEGDLVLKGSIFFALINTTLLEDFKLPAVFCGIN